MNAQILCCHFFVHGAVNQRLRQSGEGLRSSLCKCPLCWTIPLQRMLTYISSSPLTRMPASVRVDVRLSVISLVYGLSNGHLPSQMFR